MTPCRSRSSAPFTGQGAQPLVSPLPKPRHRRVSPGPAHQHHQVIMNGPQLPPAQAAQAPHRQDHVGKPADVVGILPSWPSLSNSPASRRSISPPAAGQPTHRRMEILSGTHRRRMSWTWTGRRSCSNGSASWEVSMTSIGVLSGRLSTATLPSTSRPRCRSSHSRCGTARADRLSGPPDGPADRRSRGRLLDRQRRRQHRR
jgi:hypothetical protein